MDRNHIESALFSAAEGGHAGVISSLIASGRLHFIDPATFKLALIAAAAIGHEMVVSILLLATFSTGLQNPFDSIAEALVLSVEQGHAAIVDLLIGPRYSRGIPIERFGDALIASLEKGHPAIAETLIRSNRFRDIPRPYLDDARTIASEKGFTEIANRIEGALAPLPPAPVPREGSCFIM